MSFFTRYKYPRYFRPYISDFVCRRWKHVLRKIKEEQNSIPARAVNHFDDLYKTVFGDQWPSIRIALLSPKKRSVVLNNLTDKERSSEMLKNEGALNVRRLHLEQKKCLNVNIGQFERKDSFTADPLTGNELENIILSKQRKDIESLYPKGSNPSEGILGNLSSGTHPNPSEVLDDDDELQREHVPSDPTQHTPLDETLKKADYDFSRIILPTSSGVMMGGASLYEFVPATKLMGMEHFVPESAHYTQYQQAHDLSVDVERDGSINFPDNLDVFAFERGNCSIFPLPSKGSSDVLDYHEFDLALLAPVLALDLKSEDRVLDMCSSSGDTAILIAQTLIPKIFVANIPQAKGVSYTYSLLGNYFPNILEDDSDIIITSSRPLDIEDNLLYNKILIGVPSLCDRQSMTKEEDNVFHPLRAKERVNLPEFQKRLLRKALELVDEGGTVVYFTESLSPVQNEGIVVGAVADMCKTTGCRFVVKDLSDSLNHLEHFLKIENSDRCGHIVVPFLPNNYGPLYFCKIVKTFHDASTSSPNGR